MDILQICPHPYDSFGGVPEYVRNISERLVNNFDVTVYSAEPRLKTQKIKYVNEVRIESFRRLFGNSGFYISLELVRKLKKSKFDVIHGHSYHAFPMHASILADRKKLILNTHYHGDASNPVNNIFLTAFNPIGKRVLLKADNLIAVSEYEKKLLIKNFNISPDKITTIPCGIIKQDFMNEIEYNKNEDKKYILCVGRLKSYKGIQYLIEAMPYLDKNIFLMIVGKGPLENWLLNRITKLNISNRVLIFQDLTRKQLLEKYFMADIFVLLSKYEAYSISVAEALSSRTPCLVANTSALNEWIDDKNCFGIDYPINIIELAASITSILNQTISIKLPDKINVKIKDWDEVVVEINKIYSSYLTP